MLNGPNLVVRYHSNPRAVLAENGSIRPVGFTSVAREHPTQAVTLGSTYAGDRLDVAPLTYYRIPYKRGRTRKKNCIHLIVFNCKAQRLRGLPVSLNNMSAPPTEPPVAPPVEPEPHIPVV